MPAQYHATARSV